MKSAYKIFGQALPVPTLQMKPVSKFWAGFTCPYIADEIRSGIDFQTRSHTKGKSARMNRALTGFSFDGEVICRKLLP